ncbi:MAG: ribonuclease III [Candidatus Dadabacteria bacterium]|nr:ribonuclease III [Candidatus Dadabacteria bacterium]MDE0519820.1 ribonuclease III [Candidatus Dadabacteria bacterium]MDE0662929.1 ribonuclease III [Candidatus Dadabacteria bacterium]
MTHRKLGYEFKDPSLLETALTHSSYANEFSCPSNERLEFLGDALLGCMVSVLLYEKYPSYTEGDLSKIRSRVVSGANFAKYAEMLGLGEQIRLGKGEESTGGRERESNNANAFEALIGALYLDAGYEKTFEVVSRLFQDAVEEDDFPHDSKTQLQEVSQSVFGKTPEYRVLSEEGPPHERTFTVEVRISSDLAGTGKGRSKRQSEQSAARDALRKLGY